MHPNLPIKSPDSDTGLSTITIGQDQVTVLSSQEGNLTRQDPAGKLKGKEQANLVVLILAILHNVILVWDSHVKNQLQSLERLVLAPSYIFQHLVCC